MPRRRPVGAAALIVCAALALVFYRPALAPSSAQVETTSIMAEPTVTPRPGPATPGSGTPSPPAAVAKARPSPIPTRTPRTTPLSPAQAGGTTYNELLSDSLLLNSPSVLNFKVQAFLDGQPGPLKGYREEMEGRSWSAAETIAFNAVDMGINPQFILVALEARSDVISQAGAQVPQREKHPGWPGFYTYVRWLAYRVVTAYDAARYHEADNRATFEDKSSVELPVGLNAATTAIQVVLAEALPPDRWQAWAAGDAPAFTRQFREWFGNPYADPDSPDGPAILPPGFGLPFPAGETWYYTGGPHAYDSSGAHPWSSLDFGQPEGLFCPGARPPLNRWVVAAADGIVIQAGEALVVIDHGDGWRTYYSHIAAQDRVAQWKTVQHGEPLGHPSCETEPGGSTNGTHVHFAAWRAGLGFVDIAGSTLSGWLVSETRHYDGTLERDGVLKTAEASRVDGRNDVLNGDGG